MSMFWLIALIVFGVIEAATVGLASVWFALGALAALITSALTSSVFIQIVVFLVVSIITFMLIRPLAQKFFNTGRVATNADRIIGMEGIVTEEIDNLMAHGLVSVSGALWTARSEENATIPADTKVKILRIEGVKVFVTPAEAGSGAGAEGK